MALWPDDDALLARYGNLRVKLETKREKESARILGAEGGLGTGMRWCFMFMDAVIPGGFAHMDCEYCIAQTRLLAT